MTHIEIIQEVYKNFAQGNIAGVLAHFDKEVVWIRPGEPDIPFAGTFTGMEGLGKMLTLVGRHIRLKAFTPQKFFSNENTVAVFYTAIHFRMNLAQLFFTIFSGWIKPQHFILQQLYNICRYFFFTWLRVFPARLQAGCCWGITHIDLLWWQGAICSLVLIAQKLTQSAG